MLLDFHHTPGGCHSFWQWFILSGCLWASKVKINFQKIFSPTALTETDLARCSQQKQRASLYHLINISYLISHIYIHTAYGYMHIYIYIILYIRGPSRCWQICISAQISYLPMPSNPISASLGAGGLRCIAPVARIPSARCTARQRTTAAVGVEDLRGWSEDKESPGP